MTRFFLYSVPHSAHCARPRLLVSIQICDPHSGQQSPPRLPLAHTRSGPAPVPENGKMISRLLAISSPGLHNPQYGLLLRQPFGRYVSWVHFFMAIWHERCDGTRKAKLFCFIFRVAFCLLFRTLEPLPRKSDPNAGTFFEGLV